MRGKRGRGAKVLAAPPNENQKAASFEQMDSPNLSVIDRASFLEGLQQNYGNPLHSTAMEEDLNVLEGKEMTRGKAKQRGAAEKRKETETDKGNAKGAVKRRRSSSRSAGEKVKAKPNKEQQIKEDFKRKRASGGRKSSDSQLQEQADSSTAQRSRDGILSSEEEHDEDTSWNPSPKKAKVYSFSRSRKSSSDGFKSRKSSSGSTSAEKEKASTDKRRGKRRGQQAGTDLELMLDAFLEFCDQYKESVETKAVQQSIDSFSSNVKEQLMEKISLSKELRVLKRENLKVGSLTRTKTRRLLDAKHELMRAERQVWQLQKEKAELKLRLADLKLSHAFLSDIRELNQRYLDYRHKHPKEIEKYGASSLPALLLETKHIQTAGHQLGRINKRLEKILKTNVPCK